MSSFRRESPRAFRWLILSLLSVGVLASSTFAAPADHLIISEVVVKTQAPVATNGSPFIEIANPTGAPIPMDDVYLTNGATAPATYYFNIALLDPTGSNPGGGTGGSFHARFPAGFILPAAGSIAIALNGSDEYLEAYGRNPDFELFEDGAFPDAVPEMLEAYQGSINAGLGGGGNVPVLSDAASSLILYSWNGDTDLVQDLDYIIWGSDNNVRIDKSGVSIGGGTYLADRPVGDQEAAAATGPDFGSALRRISSDEGTEITSGGNGIGGVNGDNETSENLATTFPAVVGHEPPAANPAIPAGPIVTAGGMDPAAPYVGQTVTLSVTTVDQDEVATTSFRYTVDGGSEQTVAGAQTGPGVWVATVPPQAEGAVVAWYCVATNTEDVAVVYPAGSPNFAATWTVDKDPSAGAGPAKLLLTEISTTGTDQEYVELYNPGAEAVDLSDYYLTDANYSTGNQYYYRIGEGNPSQATVGGGAFFDFQARFPDGFSIDAGDTIVISLAGSIAFSGHFGFDPDLEMYEDGAALDAVPDMRWIFGDETNNSIINRTGSGSGQPSTPGLTNGGEMVVLYHFVTGEDKVVDIDVFVWKDPSYTSTSFFFNKTGVTIGGHSYLPENGTNETDAFGTQNVFGNSYQRTDATEGGQTPTGSNGVDGRDETSEDFDATFAMMPYAPSKPGGVGPAPDPDKLLITQVCTKDVGAEFIEIHNPGVFPVNMSDYYLTDAVHTPASTFYWNIAEGSPTSTTVGGGAFEDFHAKFPDGYSLAAGDTIVVAVAGSSAFNTAYGYLPDLELYEDDGTADDIPDMAFIFGDATNNSIINRTGVNAGEPSTPGLRDSAETVILYSWKSGEDRVVDIDVFFWNDPSSTDTSFLFSKTGVTVGSHSYLPDTDTAAQTPFGSETVPGFSYHRTDGNEGTQTPTGSNGVGGRDETSENLGGTFQAAAADPARPPEPPAESDAVKLLLTEISSTGTDQEFVEIHNPSNEDVDLSDYYLTDAIYSTGSQYYWRIAEGNPNQGSVGGGAFFDWHARFPDGYTITAGATIVVSLAGSIAFNGHFGFMPDLELYEDDNSADAVPDMRYVFGDDVNNSIINRTGSGAGQPSTPGLTNGGETVILYYWVTGEDNVVDIDVFAYKDPSYATTSFFFNKTGVTIGSHSYLPELGTSEGMAYGTQAVFGSSYQRIDPNEGAQAPTGSNGVLGRDETSEDFRNTFVLETYDPGNFDPGGGPGDPDKLLITEICTKDVGAEFVEIHNPGAKAVDMSGYYLTDAVNTPASRLYWRIAEGNPSGATVGGGADGDFHAKFPAGYSLAAGDTIVVAVAGSTAFSAAYGFMPDLKLFENDTDDDSVPSMVFIFGDAENNSIINRTGSGPGQPSTPGLTPGAETVILYHWKPGEDRVVDIDAFFWKDSGSTETGFLFSKTGVTVGSHSYLPDTDTVAQTPFTSETDPGFSYHRTDGGEGTQTPTGSNGVDGRDETSENFNGTFGIKAADPARPPEPPVGSDALKLLLTEVCTTGTDQEFVEIHNSSGQDVDLSDYYLTDAIYSTGSQYYWRIAEGNPNQGSVGGGAFFDFHARFPAGYTIAADSTIVVSIAGSVVYEEYFGFFPHLELFEDNEFEDNIPDMRYVFGDDVNNSIVNRTGSGSGQPSTPGLTNGGEAVILYHWNTGEDRVTDIDVFTYKDPSYNTTSFFFNKTGVTIGGHSYLAEQGTNEGAAFGSAATFGNSYHRIDPSEGAQAPTGSNGVDGRDETSEDFRNTFALMAYDPVRYDPPFVPVVETVAQLQVPSRTFLPGVGEEFPVSIASSSSGKSETRLRIFDLEGRIVVTLFDSRFDGSPPSRLDHPRNPFLWDGRDSLFERVKAGMYVVHLSEVNIKTGKMETRTAPVVVGTRLSN